MNSLHDLKTGEKYTVVRYGEMGFLYSVQFTLNEIQVKPFAQYPETIVLIFRKKGARSFSGLRFLPNDDFLLYSGWVDVKTEMFVSSSVNSVGMTCRQSLLSFDREYMMIAKRSISSAPLLEKIKPLPQADTATLLGKRGQS